MQTNNEQQYQSLDGSSQKGSPYPENLKLVDNRKFGAVIIVIATLVTIILFTTAVIVIIVAVVVSITTLLISCCINVYAFLINTDTLLL